MVFSDSSTKLGIVEDIDFWLDTNSTSYPTADKTRNVNERFRVVWAWIFEAFGGWIFDDDNLTNLPQAAQDLTSGTAVYALPSEALTVRSVEVKDASSGNFRVMQILTLEEIQRRQAVDEFQETNGIPWAARVVGATVELFPAPSYSSTGGFKVYFDRGVSVFAASDTTKVPGFASPFHRALSVGGALDFAVANGLTEKIEVLTAEWQKYELLIKKFYSERFKALKPDRIKPRLERYN